MAEARNAISRTAARVGCALALFLFAGVAAAQNTPGAAGTPSSEKPPGISYSGGLLRINAHDATLGDVLMKVASLTGVKIDVPDGANSERMPVVELGPGPARQVLALLLSDSGFDYLIQSADADPDRLQSVLVMTREKKGGGAVLADAAARPGRSPYARAVAQPAPEVPAAAPPESAAETASLNPQPAPAQTDEASAEPAPAPPDPSLDVPSSQAAERPNFPKTSPVPLPQSLNSQSISQQLQQMYQQRAQMNQQDRAGAPPK